MTNILTPRPGPAPEALLLTEAQAARLLATSARTIFELRRSGKLPFLKLGRVRGVRFRRSDLERFVAGRVEGGDAA